MTDIQELDPRTVERIAAGEVVERPASVVKELVENSLDAGAGRVEVAVASGGREGIRVSDDGIGMTEREARRAVEKHTTSKISGIDDLEAGVGTLGFRGEALHAIGAVSRMTVTTRPRSDRSVETDRGTELTVEGGEVVSVEPAGCPAGTTVEVDDLFYNVPARRKYLKQDATEFAHVNRVVTSYALANPDVAVSLSHDGRETFATAGGGDRREAVMAVYGREVASSMIEVESRASDATPGGSEDNDPDEPGDDRTSAGADTGASDADAAADAVAAGTGSAGTLPDGPLDAVTGLVSHPETNRASREYLSTYVNGRYVTDGAVRDAVLSAYDTQLAPDRYPFAVLFLDLPAGEVDVNAHPRKLEVRWAEEEAVRRQVQTAVEDALGEEGILRSSAPRGRSSPDQTEIKPSSTSGEADEPPTGSAASTDEPPTGSAASTDETGTVGTDEPATGSTDSADEPSTSPKSTSRPASSASGSTAHPSQSPAAGEPESRSPAAGEPESRSPVADGPDTQTTLSGDDAHPTTEYDTLPALRVLGQLHDTYIVAEDDDGLVLIDQHAADERINYERLKERFDGDTTTQALAEPVRLELTAREAALFDTYRDALARLGFHANRVDDRTVEVTTVPGPVAESAGPTVIRDLLNDLVAGDRAAEETVEAVADELLADMACYPSITGNTSLTDGSVVDLLSALDGCENPWACPHGRPVVIHIDSDEIDDRFERDYPGHGR